MKTNKVRGIIAALLSATCLFSMVGCSSSGSGKKDLSFKAGTYTGAGDGRNGKVKVEVEFTDSSIKSVKVIEHGETEGIADAPIEKIPEKIVKNQTLAIDAISGATMTGDGILQAVEDCVAQAGGNIEALKEKKETTANKEVEEITTDVVVVGAGAAGTAAALSAIDNGAKVVLLEKTPSPMGAGTLAGGMFAADSKAQKDAKATVDKEWLFDEYMKASSGYMNSRLVRKVIDEAGSTVDFLEENGCDFNLAEAGTGGSYEHIGMPTTLHGYNEGGTVALNKLVESFEKKGGEVRFNTPATELIKDDKGNVTGVVAKKEDSSTLKVKAKSVILATGGFGGNAEMLEEYVGKNYTMGEIASNTGDGIKMAWSAGADEYGIGTMQYFWETFKAEEIGAMSEKIGDGWYALTTFSKYPNLRVNTLGQRFSDETKSTLYAQHGAEIHMQPKETEYVIIDSAMLDTIAEKGTVAIEDQFGKWEGNRQFFMEFNEPNDTDMFIEEERTPYDFRELLDPIAGDGVVFKGESIEELAEAMGVDKEAFIESVNQYNGAIEKGDDELFFSETDRLIPVKKGPYYAIKFSARNLGTLGGVRINENIEAIDENGNPIKGLYVAGADAGGMYGQSYVDFEGGTLGFAYTSGKIAGTNAANFSKSN